MTDTIIAYPNLAAARLGTEIVSVTDQFFASAERMLAETPPRFIADKFDDHGKWMDGWETRRRRGPGHDSAIVRLGAPGDVHQLEIDTAHFTGNYPMAASVDACVLGDGEDPASARWQPLLTMTALHGDHLHRFTLPTPGHATHVRLNLHPDGGIARFRVLGRPRVDWAGVDADQEVELSAARLGGQVLALSDAHYGWPHSLLYPGRGLNMGDGWETRRRREPGFDWCVIGLGHRGRVTGLEVDTAFFKGNFPAQISVQAANLEDHADTALLRASSMFWPTLLTPQPLGPDAMHHFQDQLETLDAVTHVRLNMHPDGGISRFRVFGQIQ
ncbi:allantoicase [Alcanivoracaceae bacterium MT1]